MILVFPVPKIGILKLLYTLVNFTSRSSAGKSTANFTGSKRNTLVPSVNVTMVVAPDNLFHTE